MLACGRKSCRNEGTVGPGRRTLAFYPLMEPFAIVPAGTRKELKITIRIKAKMKMKLGISVRYSFPPFRPMTKVPLSPAKPSSFPSRYSPSARDSCRCPGIDHPGFLRP